MRFLNYKVILSLLVFFLIVSLKSAHAETTGSYGQSCMTKEAVYIEKKASANSTLCQTKGPCITPPPGFVWPGGTKKDHTLKLKGVGLPPSSDIYILGCIVSGNNLMKCTTGNSTTDNELKKLGFIPRLLEGYQFNILSNPQKSDSAGRLIADVRSYTSESENHKFFGVYSFTPLPTGPGLANEGSGSTLQYGTFNFSEGLPQDPGNCVGIFWDPKGRTFDAKSLEPIPDVKVKLFVDVNGVRVPVTAGTEQYSGVKKNPINTRFNGLFQFFVPNGIYYLQPTKIGYTFPLSHETVDSNYKKAYYCDKEVGQPLYTEEFPIVEENKVTHCDIPLDPGVNAPLTREAEIKNYLVMNIPGRSPENNITQFSGLISHPLSFVSLTGQTSGKEVARVKADKHGRWIINLNISQLPENEAVIVKPIKIDLTKNVSVLNKVFKYLSNYLNTIVQAQEDAPQGITEPSPEIVVQPIFRYLDGYAYDTSGQVIPNAKVEVRLEADKTVYAYTKADQKGYFFFAPNELPIFSYYLQYTDSNGSVLPPTTTSKFAKENSIYLTENKIKLVSATKKGTPVPTKDVVLVPTQYESNQPYPSPLPTIVPNSQVNSRLIIILILVLLVAAVGIIGYYFHQNSKPPPDASLLQK